MKWAYFGGGVRETSNRIVKSCTAFFLALFLITIASMAHCSIIRVKTSGSDSQDGSTWALAKKTVQAAINATVSGDEVWVCTGTYVQCITLKDGVAVYGGFAGTESVRTDRDWSTNVTTLDGGQLDHVVYIPRVVTSSTVIDGFTITNGRSAYGGGIYCHVGSPVVSHNIITANTATGRDGRGGGIYCYGAATICNNTITSNTASGSDNGSASNVYTGGGGIFCDVLGNPTVTNNIISNNTAIGGSDKNNVTFGGGGIYNYSNAAVISNNTITGNTVSASGAWRAWGGGIFSGGVPTIAGNTISGNSVIGEADCFGGGVSSYWGVVSGNTVSGNTVTSGYNSSYGGGIDGEGTMRNNLVFNNAIVGGLYAFGGGISGGGAITNNTVAGNTASGLTGVYGGGVNSDSGSLVNNIVAFNSSGLYACGTSAHNNCVYNPGGINYAGTTPAGAADINTDPLFAGVGSGNYHLTDGSLCVDAGDNSIVGAGWTDRDGNARVYPTVGNVDMGCYEAVFPGLYIPSISSVAVSPTMAAVGDTLHIVVHALHSSAVMANSLVSLTKTGATTWEGSVTASGIQSVGILATGPFGATAIDAASYKTASVLCMAGQSSFADPIVILACSKWLFKFHGKVGTIVNPDTFFLDDGSALLLRVVAPGCTTSLHSGDHVAVRGMLNVSQSTLQAQSANVIDYH